MKLARLALTITLFLVAFLMIAEVTVPSILYNQPASFVFGTLIVPMILFVVAWQYGIKKLH